jgi:N-methylhydantoinase B
VTATPIPTTPGGADLDPVTFAVLGGSFRSLVNEMNVSLFRSALSPVITEGRDIGGAVFDRDGRLVAQGDWDLAVFVGMLEFSVAHIITTYGDELEPDDVFIMNDPFIGGTHFNDVGIVRPVYAAGDLIGFVGIVGHWPDVGGQEPGSFVANAREHFQEGLRIPPVPLIKGGKPIPGVYELIRANMRLAEDRMGDLRAQVGATGVGLDRLVGMVEKYGAAAVAEAMRAGIAHSENLIRAEIAAIPDGVYEGEDSIDMQSLDFPEPRAIRVRMTKSGNGLHFDFSASDEQAKSACNSTLSATSSAVYVTVKSMFPSVPMSHGCFAPIDIEAPLGTIVNARPPAAISSMAATVYDKVIGACLKALSLAMPDRAVGSPYNLINLTLGGHCDGQDYVGYLYSEGGFGGRQTKDGPAGLVSLFGGGAKITPVEVMERRYPLQFSEWALWPDSGGPGTYRGGVGSRKTFALTRGTARMNCLGDREFFPPFGVAGGGFGAAHGLLLDEGTPQERNLTLKAVGVELTPGAAVTIKAGGGGGYGDPLDRDPALVLDDVVEGFVTPGHAAEAYGVVVTGDAPTGWQVDPAATQQLRAERRAQRDQQDPKEQQ